MNATHTPHAPSSPVLESPFRGAAPLASEQGDDIASFGPGDEVISHRVVGTSRLAWSRPVLVALIDHGHLPARTVTNPISGMRQRIVDESDLDHFDTRYVSLFALAKERGAYYLKLKRELDGARVQPAFDTAQVPATFYRRDELPPP